MIHAPAIPRTTLDRLFEGGNELWKRYQTRRGGRFHGFVPGDYEGAYETLRPLRAEADSFLELGSGAGVITILADLLGFDACGIEIEPWLVESARDLAEAHESEARFATGSFVPAQFRGRGSHLDPDFHVTYDGEAGYLELGHELDEFDLVYAFPWPGEEELFFEMMRRFARPQALFLTYSATDGFELHR